MAISTDSLLESILAFARQASATVDDCTSITGVCQHIAGMHDMSWDDLRGHVLAALRAASTDYDREDSPELCECGMARQGGEIIYWWNNGSETRWQSDRPDWWGDVFGE